MRHQARAITASCPLGEAGKAEVSLREKTLELET